ncbi:MAG: IS1380 family transposase [Desulfatibacillaceae bacterium]|nr:IS1380 family transposase [Desulfatibacillaceae bacterium]
MPKIIIEKSDSEFYTAYSGLQLVGILLNGHSGLCRRVNLLPGNPSASHSDVLKSYLGLLCIGKGDFEAVAGVRQDDWFKAALSIRRVPSKETMRQRFDGLAQAFDKAAQDASIEMLKSVRAFVTALSTGHVPLDIDVFTMDNSNTKKEGVSRTYNGKDGYAPIAAYLGEEGWCVGLDLREGSQHSQKEFLPFLGKVVRRSRRLTKKQLLVRLDSAHCAIINLVALREYKKLSYIVKWNPRKADPGFWRQKVFGEGRVSEPRPGKKVAVMTVHEMHEVEGKKYRFMRVVRVTERTIDKTGQMLVVPDIELEGWWTSLLLPEEKVIALYEGHATSEQFHSEIKTDLDMERLPSGKFATNALVLTCAGMAYNILRLIGQKGLLGKNSPVRHKAKRRRIRTVIEELMIMAGRLVKSARQLRLRFGRHCPAYEAFLEVHTALSPG